MFLIGDKIVYPMHGAGIVEEIEEKKILGETRNYYVLKVPYGDMKIMIPVDSSDEIGVRAVVTPARLADVMGILGEESTEMSNNWNRRNRENMEKLKTGDIDSVAEVVRNLMRMDHVKKLSTGEKKLLTNARQILISEMVLVSEMGKEEAEEAIAAAVLAAG